MEVIPALFSAEENLIGTIDSRWVWWKKYSPIGKASTRSRFPLRVFPGITIGPISSQLKNVIRDLQSPRTHAKFEIYNGQRSEVTSMVANWSCNDVIGVKYNTCMNAT